MWTFQAREDWLALIQCTFRERGRLPSKVRRLSVSPSLFLSDRPREPLLSTDWLGRGGGVLPLEWPGAASCLPVIGQSSGAQEL